MEVTLTVTGDTRARAGLSPNLASNITGITSISHGFSDDFRGNRS